MTPHGSLGLAAAAGSQRLNVTRAIVTKLSVVIAGHRQAGSGVAEFWSGSALLGILHKENSGIVLRLESHARGPLMVSAVALERALAEVRERLGVAVEADPGCASSGGQRRPRPRSSLRSAATR